MKQSFKFTKFLLWTALINILLLSCGFAKPLPFVKQLLPGEGELSLTTVSVSANSKDLTGEVKILREVLREHGIGVKDGLFPVRLEIEPVSFPTINSDYREKIKAQGYRLCISNEQILIQAQSPAGVFYGIQTLAQLIDSNRNVPNLEILDWPDLAVRMVMIDPANQPENIDRYKRMIRFCARYKINGLHMHLSGDSSLALYHEDYPWLMSPHPLRPEEVTELVEFAGNYHIEIMPDIQSLGHAAMFIKYPLFRDILCHVTPEDHAYFKHKGFTNTLCPASDLTYKYLDKMYARIANLFPYPIIHAAMDEVPMTTCARCDKKFPGISKADWFLGHLSRCQELARKHGKLKMAIWNDVLPKLGLSEEDIAGRLSPEHLVIFDWHYINPIPEKHCKIYKKKGFDVIGCPAMFCSKWRIIPDKERYENIQEFARIARENDLLGIDTTIWLPMRYMSDILWVGVAFSAVQSWSGSNWDEAAFYSDFLHDFFGSSMGAAFQKEWTKLNQIIWRQDEIYLSCWFNEKILAQAQEMAEQRNKEVRLNLKKLHKIREQLTSIGSTVKKNHLEWDVIEQSVAIYAYTMERLLASQRVYANGKWNKELVAELDNSCRQCIEWIEADWVRNRFALSGAAPHIESKNTNQLLQMFRLAHKFDEEILNK